MLLSPPSPLKMCTKTANYLHFFLPTKAPPLYARIKWKPLMSHFRPTARVPRGCNTSALLISARASTHSRFSVSDPALHQQLRRGVGTIGYISSVEEAITKFVLRNCPWTYWIPRKKEEKKRDCDFSRYPSLGIYLRFISFTCLFVIPR